MSLMDELRAIVAEPLPDETIEEGFRYRPDFSVVYDTRIDMKVLRRSNKQATFTDPKTKTEELDPVISAGLTLAAQCRGIKRNGELLHDSEDEPLTFRSRMFLEVTNAMDNASAMKKWFGSDAEILRHSRLLGDKSAIGEALRGEAVDPTLLSTD